MDEHDYGLCKHLTGPYVYISNHLVKAVELNITSLRFRH